VAGEVLNAGTGREISIGDLLTTIGQLMERDVQPARQEERLRPDASEVQRLVCDSNRLRELTGWQPMYRLEDGLRETIAWLSEPANLARYKTAVFNL
jgi:nucleoside-diphosphate-sugar epimerase